LILPKFPNHGYFYQLWSKQELQTTLYDKDCWEPPRSENDMTIMFSQHVIMKLQMYELPSTSGSQQQYFIKIWGQSSENSTIIRLEDIIMYNIL